MSSELSRQLLSLRCAILKPTSKLNLVEWADSFRYLSPESSSTPGKWSTALVEAARGPMLAVTEPGVTKITVMGPTQLLKTEFINNVCGYFIHQDASPIIVMQPIEKLCDTWATDRLAPMIRDTPVLTELIADSKERDSGNTKLHKLFPGGHITVVSAGSPSDVASRPVRVVLMDEVDKYKVSGQEGDPEKLIEQRTETFWNALSIAVCSPTLEGSSKIAARFAESDQRFFHGLCPHCGNLEKLQWQQVRYEENEPSTAQYECSHCQVLWSEDDRLKAVSKGKYIASKPFNGHAGFHVNAIASPWQPLSRMVEKFIEAKKDHEKMKVFVNTSLAETWRPSVELPDYERLYERREPYVIGQVPGDQVKFLSMGVDIQADRIEAQIVGWTRDKQSYTLDYKIIPGATHTDEPWIELRKLIQSSFTVSATTREMPISFTCIDSGFNTSKVHSFVQQFSPNKVRAIKGSDSLQTYFKMGSDISANFDGSKDKFAHKTWIVGSSFLKTELFNNLKLPVEDSEGVSPSGYAHFPEFDLEFFRGICSEALSLEKGKYVWEKVFRRNEPLDTFNYARVAASMFGLDRFKQQEWEALEGILEKAAAPKPMPSPKPANQNRNQQKSSIWHNRNLKPR